MPVQLIKEANVDKAAQAQLSAKQDANNGYGIVRALKTFAWVITGGYAFSSDATSYSFNSLVQKFAAKKFEVLTQAGASKQGFRANVDVNEFRAMQKEMLAFQSNLVSRVRDLTESVPADERRKIVDAAKFQVQQAFLAFSTQKAQVKALVQEFQGELSDSKATGVFEKGVTSTANLRRAYEQEAEALVRDGFQPNLNAAKAFVRSVAAEQIADLDPKKLAKRIQFMSTGSYSSQVKKGVVEAQAKEFRSLAEGVRKLNSSIEKAEKGIKAAHDSIKAKGKEATRLQKEFNDTYPAGRPADKEDRAEFNTAEDALNDAADALSKRVRAKQRLIVELQADVVELTAKRDEKAAKFETLRKDLFPKVHAKAGQDKKHKMPSKLNHLATTTKVTSLVQQQVQRDIELLKRLNKQAQAA